MTSRKKHQISIVTPSYNQGSFIEQTILSVLDQGYNDLEYIIVDGGSTDNTLEIIKKYGKYLKFWISEKDNGQSHAINKGMKLATGDVVNWLNSDDYLQPNALQHIARVFEDPGVNAYSGISRIFGEDRKDRFSNGTDLYMGNLTKTIALARIDQPETYFRRSVWQEIGYLNQNLHYLMDRDFWIRYLFRYGLNGFYKDNQIISNFRLHTYSKSVSQSKKFEEESWHLWNTYAKQLNWQSLASALDSFGYDTTPIDLTEHINDQQNISELELQSYLFLGTKLSSYATDNRKQAVHCSQYILKKKLDDDNQKINADIDWRLKYIPLSVKKAKHHLSKLFIKHI